MDDGLRKRIEARVAEIRASPEWRLPSADPQAAEPQAAEVERPAGAGDDTVMLAFRVPRRIRERAHLAARASGETTQAWLLRVVTDAVDVETTPGGRQASLLWESIREHMGRLADDGTYERVASSIQDPMLAT